VTVNTFGGHRWNVRMGDQQVPAEPFSLPGPSLSPRADVQIAAPLAPPTLLKSCPHAIRSATTRQVQSWSISERKPVQRFYLRTTDLPTYTA